LLLLAEVQGFDRAVNSFPTRRSSDLHRRVDDLHGETPHRSVDYTRVGNWHRRICGNRNSDRCQAHESVVDEHFHAKHPAARWCGHHQKRPEDRKSTRLNSSHVKTSYAVFCLKKTSS